MFKFDYFCLRNKLGVSPVVASVLLLVVCIVSVLCFAGGTINTMPFTFEKIRYKKKEVRLALVCTV